MSVEINSGIITKRQDMKTTQEEEAANMIVKQVAEVKAREVPVAVDDTDIFVCLLYILLPRWHSNFDRS